MLVDCKAHYKSMNEEERKEWTYDLLRELMQVPIALREMVHPRPHEVPREEHRHVRALYAR